MERSFVRLFKIELDVRVLYSGNAEGERDYDVG